MKIRMAASSRQRPALLAAVAVSMLLSFSTAASASDGYIGEDPPGDGGGGGTGDLTRLLPTACVNGELWELRDDGSPIPGLPGQTGFRWLVRPNNVCPLTGTFTSAVVPRTITGTTTLLQVPAGWEVWRFYGDGDPREGVVRGYTVSWAATRAWNDSSNVITVVPHPDDSGTPTSRGPWRERTYTNVHGETVTVAEAGQISTNPPFRRFGDSCTSLRQPGAVTAALAADSDATRAQLFGDYNTVLSAAGGRWGSRTAAAAINASNSGPISSPDQIVYEDGIPCSSPYEYASFDGAQLSIEGTFQGSCVVPVTRVAQRMSDGSLGFRSSFGAAYSTSYGQAGDYQTWRKIIQSEIMGRSSSPHLIAHRQPTPRQPSAIVDNRMANYSRAEAAAAAANHANCRPGFLGLEGPDFDASPTDIRLYVNLDMPEVFQLGGAFTPDQPIVVRHSQLLCQGGECQPQASRQPISRRTRLTTAEHVTRVRYQLNIQASGLVLCQTNNPAERCDWRMEGPTSNSTWDMRSNPQPDGEPRSSQANLTTSRYYEHGQRAGLEFFSATNPGEQVTATISNVTADYATYRWESYQIGWTSCVEYRNGGSLGETTGTVLNGPVPHRNLRNVTYFPLGQQPSGTVTQWYTYNGEPLLPGPDGLWSGRTEPWLSSHFQQLTASTPVDQWSCSAVRDDRETSSEAALQRSQIQINNNGASRPVIGVAQR